MTESTAHDLASLSRRQLLIAGAGGAAALAFPSAALAATASDGAAPTSSTPTGHHAMSTITTKDGAEIFYKDWGDKSAQPIVFSHGWPLTADDWDNQMLYFLQHGFRVIAHDRRGHGRSSQTFKGNEMDTYSDDLAALMTHLDIHNAIHVGHSTGGGEVARYLGRHGSQRAAKGVLIGAVPPVMVKSASNPGGLPIDVFDGIRAGVASNRPQFYWDLTLPFYGYNRPDAKVSEGIRRHWWEQGMAGSVWGAYECVKAFSETDFTEDLKKIDIPMLVLHGTDDQIVPYQDAGVLSAKLLKKATLKLYDGLPHGMCTTNPEIINPDLLAFFKS